MNWKYLSIVLVLAFLVGAGTLWQVQTLDFSLQEERKETPLDSKTTYTLDKDSVLEKIEQGKEFLLRMEHPLEHGFYKKYDAPRDTFEERLHTVYSASIIYTLLKAYDSDKDERIIEKLPAWAGFLLSMQSQEPETFGAFHYSYYLETKEKEMKFVVGTAALSIFTLLDLYERTEDTVYLSSAKMAGDWLQSMQGEGGVMKAYKKYREGEWVEEARESLLYNGQVLAALSRLYQVTGADEYYEAAEKIARHFIARVAQEGCYLGDDYRIKNPISSAWVVMSLLDFYKIQEKESYKNIILGCSRGLLSRQEEGGAFAGAYSTSGNGWLAEVMAEMYQFCKEEGELNCKDYKDAVLRVMVWLFQNTYSEENSVALPNPERALGGLFWNQDNKYIRTDSVCHGLNAYLGIVDDL